MIFLCHAAYLILLILYYQFFIEFDISIADFKKLRGWKRMKYRFGPLITIALVYLFPVMNYLIVQANPGAIIHSSVHQFINATAFTVFCLFRRIEGKTKVGWPYWVSILAYLVYTVVKNITIHDSLIVILLAQAMSIVFTVLMGFTASLVGDAFRILSMAEVAEKEREMEETHRIAAEYEAKLAEEKRLKELEERTPEAIERKRQEYLAKERQYQQWKESAARREAERKAQYANVSRKPVYVDRVCDNCRHLINGRCTRMANTATFGSRIKYPQLESCIWFEED